MVEGVSVTKIVFKPLGAKVAKAGTVKTKRVVGADGRYIKIPSIDANSASFSSDLTLVFQKNVAKRRRENKRKFGSPDRVSK